MGSGATLKPVHAWFNQQSMCGIDPRYQLFLATEEMTFVIVRDRRPCAVLSMASSARRSRHRVYILVSDS